MKEFMKKINQLFAHEKQSVFGGAAIIAFLPEFIWSYFATGGYIFLKFGWRYVAIAAVLALILAILEQVHLKNSRTSSERAIMITARVVLATLTAGANSLLSQL
ncbi:MAG: hypothetical protein IJC68_00635 [Firmicutes bacterium]|nr:hypothetical protein [Bacillota bacterium]